MKVFVVVRFIGLSDEEVDIQRVEKVVTLRIVGNPRW